MADKSIPQSERDLGEIEVAEHVSFFEKSWESSALPYKSQHSLAQIEIAITGISSIMRLLDRATKNLDKQNILEKVLTENQIEGLFCAQSILIDEIQHRLEWLREECNKESAI